MREMSDRFYGLLKGKERRDLWEELATVKGLWDEPWCIAGDFNVVWFPVETGNGRHLSTSMRVFFNFIDEFELVDPPLGGGGYTWSRGQGARKDVPLELLNYWDNIERLRPLSEEDRRNQRIAKDEYSNDYLGVRFPRIMRAWRGFFIGGVGGEVMQVFEEFHSQNVVLQSLYATFLVLILKKRAASDVQDFKPISLVGSLYKILAKVLVNKLKSVIDKVVLNNHNAFVGGRQIMDATLVANVVINLRKRSSNAFSSLIAKVEEGGFVTSFKVVGRSGERGLKINMQKSEIIPVGGTEDMERAVAIFGCKVGKLPTSYLGLPLRTSHKSCGVRDESENRIRKSSKGVFAGRYGGKKEDPLGLQPTNMLQWQTFRGGRDGGGCWEVHFRRSFQDWELEEVTRFLEKVQEGEDSLVWKNDERGKFSVKSYYKSLRAENIVLFPAKEIWRSVCSS
ncbi:hypothetical protein CK203_089067 [Vitis vinifera]|uniref:Reverse transcriptase domain-containing protein n=1 Tax=Vitis vinifera TaxID=29760 RepID=A0A438F5Q7_VITVI|nr:hypothetical protein CK203_089067 [Vitis vinifera]